MSDRPLAKRKLKRAVPLEPGDRSSIRLPALPELDTAVRGNGDTKILKKGELLPIFIRVEDPLPIRGWGQRGQGLAASLAAMLRLAVREAPAWLVSMVVHTVTLVAMAMAAVPGPANYQAAAADRRRCLPKRNRRSRRSSPKLPDTLPPNTLDEDTPAEPAAAESKPDQEKAGVRSERGVGRGGAGRAGLGQHGCRHGAGRQWKPVPIFGLPPGVVSDLMSVTGSGGSRRPRRHRAAAQAAATAGRRRRRRQAPPALALTSCGRRCRGTRRRLSRRGATRSARSASPVPSAGWPTTNCPTAAGASTTGWPPSCHGACRDPGKLAEARNAATALALLPFLGSNNTHKESKQLQVHRLQGLVLPDQSHARRPGGGRSERPGAGRHVFARPGHHRPVRSLRHDPRQEPLWTRRGRR